MNNNVNQRWYDTDPTVSLAVSFIRNLPPQQQASIAKKIIEKGESLGIKINESRIILNRRWYDENEELSSAMEYLKNATAKDKKIIALDVIDILTEMK